MSKLKVPQCVVFQRSVVKINTQNALWTFKLTHIALIKKFGQWTNSAIANNIDTTIVFYMLGTTFTFCQWFCE